MKKGERPHEGVKQLVRQLAVRRLRPKNKQIKQAVWDKFGEDISERTIARYCKEAELPTSSRASEFQQQEATSSPLCRLSES